MRDAARATGEWTIFGQTGHDLGKDAVVAPALPAVVTGLLQDEFRRRFAHHNLLRRMKIVPLSTCRSATRHLPWDFRKQGPGRAIRGSASRKDQTRSPFFSDDDSRHPSESVGPGPTTQPRNLRPWRVLSKISPRKT